MSVEDAAEVVGISRSLAYELVRKGELPSLRLGLPELRAHDGKAA